LEELSQVQWRNLRFLKKRSVGTFTFSDAPVVAEIQHPFFWFSHWIAVQGKWVHDPNFSTRFQTNEYPRTGWLVSQVFEPIKVETLRVLQKKRWLKRYLSPE